MRRLGSVPAEIFSKTMFRVKIVGVVFAAVAIIGVAMIGVGCSGDDTPTGGGTSEATVTVPLLVAEVVCPETYSDTLTDRVAGDLRFVSVHGGHFQTMHFESPGNMAMFVAPGEYEVRVHSRRCSSEVIMPGTVVVDSTSLTVRNQVAPGTLPAMSVVDGTLRLINEATVLDPDTVRVLFRYPRGGAQMTPDAEADLIDLLNDGTGRHLDVRHMYRDPIVWQPLLLPYDEFRYTLAINDGVYLTDLVDRCLEYMRAHSEIFPQSMLINAGYQLPCVYGIDYEPGEIILD